MRFPANGEPFNGQPGSLVLSYHEPATPNPVLMLFLTTCILELATELLQAISGFSFLSAQRNFRSQSAGAGSDARRNVRGSDAPKSIGGSDATFGGTKCTEEHQWTQGPLRGEAFAGSTCSFLPRTATPNPVLMLFLTTCILELATELLQAFSGFKFLSAQRFLERDFVQDHYGMTKQKKRKTM